MPDLPTQVPHDQRDSAVRDAVEGFKDFWSRWGNAILLTITAILLIWAAYRFWNSRQDAAYQGAWTDLTLADNPYAFEDVAAKHSDPAVTALAELSAADLLLREAVLPAAADASAQASQEGGAADTPEKKLAWAGELYEAVAANPPHPVYRLRALMGLAQVAETQRAWDQAAQHYEAVVATAGETYDYYAASAKARLALLEELKQPVVFAPEPKLPNPAAFPFTQPTTMPTPPAGDLDTVEPPDDATP